MVPHDYRGFVELLRGEVRAGRVPVERVDDANRRILAKKFEPGLFESPHTDRSHTSTIGSAAHRELAREAVRRSRVLLKNSGGLLPLAESAKVFVAGKNADDIGNQSGGWDALLASWLPGRTGHRLRRFPTRPPVAARPGSGPIPPSQGRSGAAGWVFPPVPPGYRGRVGEEGTR